MSPGPFTADCEHREQVSLQTTARPALGYVVKMFPRLSETFILNEILELERQGLVLHIFSLKRPSPREARLTACSIRSRVTYLPERIYHEPLRVLRAQLGVLRRYPGGYLKTLLHVVRGRELRSLARGLRRFCQTCCLLNEMDGVQHLHAHFASDPTRLASWAKMISKVSFSVSTHAKDLYQDGRVSSPGLRYKLSQARFVIANSAFSARELLAAFQGQTPARILTIYNGVDLSQLPLRTEEPKKALILSVGRLVKKKGFDDLLKACSILKASNIEFQCEIIGTGELQGALKKSINDLGLEKIVCLRGEMAHGELCKRYIDALMFVLPCVVTENGDRDILPNVLKEAMAVGVPVITTLLAGIEELIQNEQNGLLVRAGDVEGLSKAIRRLLQDRVLRRGLASRSRQVIEERFDSRVNFASLGDLLRAELPARIQEPRRAEPATNPVYAHRVYHG